jgi:hypothetical protein
MGRVTIDSAVLVGSINLVELRDRVREQGNYGDEEGQDDEKLEIAEERFHDQSLDLRSCHLESNQGRELMNTRRHPTGITTDETRTRTCLLFETWGNGFVGLSKFGFAKLNGSTAEPDPSILRDLGNLAPFGKQLQNSPIAAIEQSFAVSRKLHCPSVNGKMSFSLSLYYNRA